MVVSLCDNTMNERHTAPSFFKNQYRHELMNDRREKKYIPPEKTYICEGAISFDLSDLTFNTIPILVNFQKTRRLININHHQLKGVF